MGRLSGPTLAIWLAVMGVLLSGGQVLAFDRYFVGARGQAMGGALTAAAADVDAQYYNPAVFGLFGQRDGRDRRGQSALGRKDFGLGADATAGYRFDGNLSEFTDRLDDVNLDALADSTAITTNELRDWVQFANDLAGVDNPGNGVTFDATAAAAGRLGTLGIGVRGYAQASGLVAELDTANLGFRQTAAEAAGFINQLEAPNEQLDVLSPAQRDRLVAAAVNAGVAENEALAAVGRLDDAAREADLAAGNLDETVDLLASTLENSGGDTTLDDNATEIALQGFSLVEVPISYGYAINPHLAVGGNVKLMRGRVYGTRMPVFDFDSEDIAEDFRDDYEQSTAIGLDLGLLARYGRLRFGLMGRNLNQPSFDGFTQTLTNQAGLTQQVRFASVTLDRQFSAGFAFTPFDSLTVAADLDLTAQATTLPGAETRYIAAGAEWDVRPILALRAGLHHNLAQRDVAPVLTAGFGLNIWLLRLDLAGAISTDSTPIDDGEVPEQARLAASLTVDF